MENNFLKELKKIYVKSYESKNATRSTERIKMLHGYIMNELKDDSIKIMSNNQSEENKEYKLNGVLGDKNLDIALFDQYGNFYSSIAVKFVFSNYKQNANNYFEQMVAESLNIKLSNAKIYQLIILRQNIPYFKSGKTKLWNIEHITDEYLIKKYRRYLEIEDIDLIDGVCLMLVDFGDYEVINKYKNIERFNFEEFAEEASKLIYDSNIKISYPLVKAGIKKSITYNDLIKLSKENNNKINI